MTLARTDEWTQGKREGEELLIPAICLIAEHLVPNRRLSADRRALLDAINHQRVSFASRFTMPYVLSIKDGLVPMGEDFDEYEGTFEGLEPIEKHEWILKVESGLNTIMRPELRIICLVSGGMMKALRYLELPFLFPLCGMSNPQQRRWLSARSPESNFAVGVAVFGAVAAPGLSIPTAPSSAVASCN